MFNNFRLDNELCSGLRQFIVLISTIDMYFFVIIIFINVSSCYYDLFEHVHEQIDHIGRWCVIELTSCWFIIILWLLNLQMFDIVVEF